jgi:hypothetical protein
MAITTTVQQLADLLDVPEKRLRDWLREDFPESAPGRGYRWLITTEMKRAMKKRAK